MTPEQQMDVTEATVSERYERVCAALRAEEARATAAEAEAQALKAQVTAARLQYGSTLAQLDQAIAVAVDAITAARPALPFRSMAVCGEMDMEVRVLGDRVIVRGCSHTPRNALDLSAAIARAVIEATGHQRREGQP